jgi:hypothetical protein
LRYVWSLVNYTGTKTLAIDPLLSAGTKVVDIPAYTFEVDTTAEFKCSVEKTTGDTKLVGVSTFKVEFRPAKLVVYIVGGNRYAGLG